MHIELECLIIGLISSLCCIISYKIIYGTTKSKYSEKNMFHYLNYSKLRNCIILCFIMGAMLHYFIRKINLMDMYCKKVCYDNECYMICPI